MLEHHTWSKVLVEHEVYMEHAFTVPERLITLNPALFGQLQGEALGD